MSEYTKSTGAERRLRSDFVREGERVDDLQRDGLFILQRPGTFRFGTDAVLLSDFAAVRPNDRVVDLGTGTGILCLLMSANEPTATFDAVELQPDMADMAARSVQMNGLEGRIRVHALDLRDAPARLGHGAHTLIVCNPPYSPKGTALLSAREPERLARHLGDLSIEEIARAGAALLKNGGRMAMIYPAPRLLELMDALRAAKLEPKRLQFVHDKPGSAPKLALLDAVKNARPMLHPLPPLILRDEDGAWSAQWKRIYHVQQ